MTTSLKSRLAKLEAARAAKQQHAAAIHASIDETTRSARISQMFAAGHTRVVALMNRALRRKQEETTE